VEAVGQEEAAEEEAVLEVSAEAALVEAVRAAAGSCEY
jgi:hypothetical protein